MSFSAYWLPDTVELRSSFESSASAVERKEQKGFRDISLATPTVVLVKTAIELDNHLLARLLQPDNYVRMVVTAALIRNGLI